MGIGFPIDMILPDEIHSRAQAASRAAQTTAPESLLSTYEHAEVSDLQMLACLVQELVLRRVDVAGTAAERFWNTRVIGHPLAHLPLTLMSTEAYVDECVQAYVDPDAPAPARPSIVDIGLDVPRWPGGELDVSSIETSPDDALRLTGVFDDWKDGSNGRTDCAQFVASTDIDVDRLSIEAIASLPAACLKDFLNHIDRTDILYLTDRPMKIISPPWMYMTLLSAATRGGAYTYGFPSSYGRLAVWQSITALVGLPADTPIADVDAAVHRCQWISFTALSSWFYDVAWDVGLVCVREDRRTIAVLAGQIRIRSEAGSAG